MLWHVLISLAEDSHFSCAFTPSPVCLVWVFHYWLKQAGSANRERAWGCLNDTPTPLLCLEQSLATVPTSKRCRALFSSFVTAHNRKLIRSSAQDGRKMVAKPKKMGHRFYRYPIDFIVVRPAGIEPAAYCLGGNRSIRLSYERASYLVKQSDARCQVEAGGRKVLYFRG